MSLNVFYNLHVENLYGTKEEKRFNSMTNLFTLKQ